MKYWWVNQNQTAKQEIEGGYMWSPKRNRDNSYNQFYKNMRLVENGNIVFSYYDKRIQQLGIIKRPGFSRIQPSEFGQTGEQWNSDGWLVLVDWQKLTSPISPKKFFHQLKSTLPDKYSPLNKETGDGLQNYLSAVPGPMATIILEKLGITESDIVEMSWKAGDGEDALQQLDAILEQQILNNTEIDETEQDATVKARRGQGRYRKNLLGFEKSCRITGVTDQRLLRASHIKPWRSCANNHERLDGNNGLLLTPHIDHLFDQGYITFNDQGDLLVSSRIDPNQLSRIGISSNPSVNVGTFTSEQKFYLKFHRAEVYLDDNQQKE